MKPLTFLKWAWPLEVAIWMVFGFILVVVGKEMHFGRFIQLTPYVVSFIGGQGTIAFGGPAIKRAQVVKNGGTGL